MDTLNEETCLQFLPTVTCLLGLLLSSPWVDIIQESVQYFFTPD